MPFFLKIFFVCWAIYITLDIFYKCKKEKEEQEAHNRELKQAERYSQVRNKIIEETGWKAFGPEDYEWLDKVTNERLNKTN